MSLFPVSLTHTGHTAPRSVQRTLFNIVERTPNQELGICPLCGINNGLSLLYFPCRVHRLPVVGDGKDGFSAGDSGVQCLVVGQIGLHIHEVRFMGRVLLEGRDPRSRHTCTISAPFAASLLADSLEMSRVTARTDHSFLSASSLRKMSTTEPPCCPVAPNTVIIFFPAIVSSGLSCCCCSF